MKKIEVDKRRCIHMTINNTYVMRMREGGRGRERERDSEQQMNRRVEGGREKQIVRGFYLLFVKGPI